MAEHILGFCIGKRAHTLQQHALDPAGFDISPTTRRRDWVFRKSSFKDDEGNFEAFHASYALIVSLFGVLEQYSIVFCILFVAWLVDILLFRNMMQKSSMAIKNNNIVFLVS